MSDFVFPKDIASRKIGSNARRIVHYKFNPDFWDYKEETGEDRGRDCFFELINDNKWKNEKIEVQIKGTTDINYILSNTMVSFSLKLSTFFYGVNSPYSFMLLVVDLQTEDIYYICLQEYYNDNKDRIDSKIDDQNYISIRIPVENVISTIDDSNKLIKYAKKRW